MSWQQVCKQTWQGKISLQVQSIAVSGKKCRSWVPPNTLMTQIACWLDQHNKKQAHGAAKSSVIAYHSMRGGRTRNMPLAVLAGCYPIGCSTAQLSMPKQMMTLVGSYAECMPELKKLNPKG